MTIEVDIPWRVLHCRLNRELIAATVPASVGAVVGLLWHAATDSDTSSLYTGGAVFLVLQVALACWAAMPALSKSDLQRVGLWIRASGPELHRRVRNDLRHSVDVIGSPNRVTYHSTPVSTDLTEAQLEWALRCDYYDKRELKMLRLMHHYMSHYGHEVGTRLAISYSHVVSLPYFAISEADITACTL